MKSKEQIKKEIKALKEIQPKVCPHNIFGDDNLGALGAQIDVLENNMDNDDIYEKYDVASSSEYILDAALQARQWVNGEEDEDCGGLACDWPLEE